MTVFRQSLDTEAGRAAHQARLDWLQTYARDLADDWLAEVPDDRGAASWKVRLSGPSGPQ